METKKPQIGLVAVIVADPVDSDTYEIKKIKREVHEIMDHVEEYASASDSETFIRSARYQYIFIIVTADIIDSIFAQNLHQIRHVQAIFLFDPHQKVNSPDICNLRKSSYKVSKNFFNMIITEKNIFSVYTRCKSHLFHRRISSNASGIVCMNASINLISYSQRWLAAPLIQ